MDDNAPKENPPSDFNKLDLRQLQGFSFGTQWTQEKPPSPDARERGEPGGRPRRDDRYDGGGGAPNRRDRRPHRSAAGPESRVRAGTTPGDAAPAKREFSDDRPMRREAGGDYRGGPRREGTGGAERGFRQGQGGRGGSMERGPYDSPYYTATFYPEDTSFSTLVQTIRKSCRTVELFEIARTVVAKPDRFVVVVAPRVAGSDHRSSGAGDEENAAGKSAPAGRRLLHLSVPDGMPFESDDAAVTHVLNHHLGTFFDTAEVEVDPPKGNFQVINRCGVTGELLGPPNYHRYNQIVQQHHTAKVSGMPLEVLRSRIETVRDPEIVAQWLAKMKKTTRYTWKLGVPSGSSGPAAADKAATSVEVGTEGPAGDTTESATAKAEAAEPESTPVSPAVPAFDSLEEARLFLLTHARDKVVRTAESARFHGKVLETMPPGEIRRAVEGALERQHRFPLDTANALRGRLRREHLTIFKKGSKGVSYVCAVKRKFRAPDQTFADTIGALIGFIEANPMVRASELAPKFLGIAVAPASTPPAASPPAAAAPADEAADGPPVSAAAPLAPPPETGPTPEERGRISRMQNDLTWLVHEGYVTEFIDGRLFAPPPVVEARKKEIERDDHDPENFPEAPSPQSSPPKPNPALPVAAAVDPVAAESAVEATATATSNDQDAPGKDNAPAAPNVTAPTEPLSVPTTESPPEEEAAAPESESPSEPANAGTEATPSDIASTPAAPPRVEEEKKSES